jgi:serine/threonine protein kinase
MASNPSLHLANADDRKQTGYTALLQSLGVEPTEPWLEQDWSGQGQHVEFQKGEISTVNQILTVHDTLGKGASAIVHSVKCRRILLARKTIYTNKRFTKRQAVEEVAHLTRLKHSHIVRLIGTYTWKTELSILMYPVADYNLTTFLDVLDKASVDESSWVAMARSSLDFFACLSSALEHIHATFTKHMDIKPQNILVRTNRQRITDRAGFDIYKVYIADFGIAKTYQSLEATETDGHTAFTKKYAAPEVARQDFRGLPADIFSLGCVFLELFATLYHSINAESLSTTPAYLFVVRSEGSSQYNKAKHKAKADLSANDDARITLRRQMDAKLNTGPDSSYHRHIESLSELFNSIEWHNYQWPTLNINTCQTILQMISFAPEQRPTAQRLVQQFPGKACCGAGPDELDVTVSTIDEEDESDDEMEEQELRTDD